MPRNRAIRVYVSEEKDELVFVKGGSHVVFGTSWLEGTHTYAKAEEEFPEILGPDAKPFDHYGFGDTTLDVRHVELSDE